MSAYATPTDALARLAGSTDKAPVRRALNAASSRIDAAFSSAGYATPIDTTALTQAQADRIDAELELHCLAIAAGLLSSVPSKNRGASAKQKKDLIIAERWLKQVAKRELQYPFLPRVKSGGVRVIGDNEWRATTGLYDLADAAFDERSR